MKSIKTFLTASALLVTSSLWAQQQHFSGTVLDANGEPVIGATVRVPGSATGAITDLDGHFTISVNPGTKIQDRGVVRGYADADAVGNS